MPRTARASSAFPESTNPGFPLASVTTSNSCQVAPALSPRALISASLAAKRAASECAGSARSTMSTPMPLIIVWFPSRPSVSKDGLLDRDGLGEVARLVDVESLGRGQLHREDLQRDHGEQRLEQRR